jgi:uncharacterized protein YaiL (DUF2058 family)
MAGSLKDQLLKAGLANKQQVKKASIEQRKEKKNISQVSLEKAESEARLKKQREEKAAQDRALNQARDTAAHERAIDAQIKQLIEHHKIRISDKAETKYQFVDGTAIKQIWVDSAHVTQLVRSQIRIARDGDQYSLIPAIVAARIEERRPERIIPLSSDQQTSDEDDPYADYVIPDDLMW